MKTKYSKIVGDIRNLNQKIKDAKEGLCNTLRSDIREFLKEKGFTKIQTYMRPPHQAVSVFNPKLQIEIHFSHINSVAVHFVIIKKPKGYKVVKWLFNKITLEEQYELMLPIINELYVCQESIK
jgi:hypothetical protein